MFLTRAKQTPKMPRYCSFLPRKFLLLLVSLKCLSFQRFGEGGGVYHIDVSKFKIGYSLCKFLLSFVLGLLTGIGTFFGFEHSCNSCYPSQIQFPLF